MLFRLKRGAFFEKEHIWNLGLSQIPLSTWIWYLVNAAFHTSCENLLLHSGKTHGTPLPASSCPMKIKVFGLSCPISPTTPAKLTLRHKYTHKFTHVHSRILRHFSHILTSYPQPHQYLYRYTAIHCTTPGKGIHMATHGPTPGKGIHV